MSKPKMYGKQSSYLPNAKADMRYKPHIYQRGREYADNAPKRGEVHYARRMEKFLRSETDGNQCNHLR